MESKEKSFNLISDEELAQRFEKVFLSQQQEQKQPVNKYAIPSDTDMDEVIHNNFLYRTMESIQLTFVPSFFFPPYYQYRLKKCYKMRIY